MPGDPKGGPREALIAEHPPRDGREWDSQCARCGGSTEWRECESCGGEGESWPGALYEEDPLWYDEDDTRPCDVCRGRGGWQRCGNSEAWCDSHPLPGRGHREHWQIEWFTFDAPRPRPLRKPSSRMGESARRRRSDKGC